MQISVSVSISSSLERLRTQFFTIFKKNFAYGSEMWPARYLLFLRQTGSRHTSLEVCKKNPILIGSQLRLLCFSTVCHKNSKTFNTNLHGLYLEYQRNRKYNSDFREVQILFSVSFVIKRLRMQNFACGCEMWWASQLLFL